MHLQKPVSISKAVILLSHLSRRAGVPPPKSPPGPASLSHQYTSISNQFLQLDHEVSGGWAHSWCSAFKLGGALQSHLEVVRMTFGIRQTGDWILTGPPACCVTLSLWLTFPGPWLSHLRNGDTNWVVRSDWGVFKALGNVDGSQSACNGHDRPNRPAQGWSLKQLCGLGQITELLSLCPFLHM